MAMNRKRKGERPDGLIQVALDIGYYEDGRRKRKYFYGHTRTEAEAKRDEYRAHMVSGSRFSHDITVAEWVDEFKRTYRENVNPAYIHIDDVPYNRLVREIGFMRMVDVTEADLQKAINKIAGMSFSTCDKYRQAICRVFGRAVKNRIITENPAADLELPNHTRGTHRALESWEVDLIIHHWNEPGLHAGLWVMLMLLAGLRRGEMMALDWKDVHMETRTLEIVQTAIIHGNVAKIEPRAKTEAGLRIIPICQPLWDALNTTSETDRNGLVCLSAHGLPLTESAVSRGLHTFCVALERIINGEPLFTPGRRTDIERKAGHQLRDATKKVFSFRAHDLRHTFCSMLYSSGVDVKTAAYLMGHADIRVTMEIYTHLSREKRSASEALLMSYLDALPAPKQP